MTAKALRLRRELVDIPLELDITMDEILEDLLYPNRLTSYGQVTDFSRREGPGASVHDRRAA